MAPTLAYWKMRGLVMPVRLLLEYAGAEYEDKTYTFGPEPRYLEDSDWMKDKFSLGLKFPNLPYYIDGDLKLTQVNAIMDYLGRKYHLAGRTELDRTEVAMLTEQVRDVRAVWYKFCLGPYNSETRAAYLKELPGKLQPFKDYLGDKKWLMGNQVTTADFHFYEYLYINLAVDGVCLQSFPRLQAYYDRFNELPAMKAYQASPRYIKSPITGPNANFRG